MTFVVENDGVGLSLFVVENLWRTNCHEMRRKRVNQVRNRKEKKKENN